VASTTATYYTPGRSYSHTASGGIAFGGHADPATEEGLAVVATVYRNQSGSGTCLISSGFPTPPGLVTEAMVTSGAIRVLVNGTEVAANVTGLRGRHHDGTLRSVLIQFYYSMASGSSISAAVYFGGAARSAADPPYVRPTWQMVSNNNVILPTDTDYLCSTLLHGRYLLPQGTGTAAEEKMYTALAGVEFDKMAAGLYTTWEGAATYETISAILAMWCRTGDVKYQREAVKHVLTSFLWLTYNTPTPAGAGVEVGVINPDGRTDGTNTVAHGLSAEQHGPRSFSYAQMYLMTGYRDFWGLVAFFAQYNQTNISTETLASTNIILRGNYDTPRSHYSARYGMMLAACQVDATIPVSASGMFNGRVMDFTDQLDWTIDAIIGSAWDLKWIPYNGGSGNVPAYGATISQGGVSGTFRAVGAQRYPPYIYPAGTPMPVAGFIQVRGITGGSFAAGALTGIGATATGPQESDYRQGLTGCNSDGWIVPNDGGGGTKIPIFQFTFVANTLIDYYLYYQTDSRIPGVVKTLTDILLSQIRVMRPGDSQYGKTNATWGNPIYGKPYNLENPINTTADAPCYELPEYPRLVAFLLKTVGEDTVNGATYTQWYSRLVDTANIAYPNVFSQTWKNFGQFYGWCQDGPWMLTQTTLVDFGPATMREPTAYATIPGDVPDLQRS